MSRVKLGVLGYLKEGDETLMLYRNKKENDVHEGKWNGLGGKIELGESPEEALKREVLEEANIKILEQKLHGIITFPNFSQDEDWYVYLFTSNSFVKSEDINFKSDEGELHWVKNEKIKSLNLWEGDHLFLNWMEREKFFSAKMVYQEKKLVHHEVFFYS